MRELNDRLAREPATRYTTHETRRGVTQAIAD
jgi:hypothetical protein